MAEAKLERVLRQADRLCSARGVRLTAQRRTVLRLLCASDKPLSAYEILERMRTGNRQPAPPTVYRALDFLLAQGLVHKLESLHAFIGCAHPEHPHCSQFLICTDCGTVNEVEDSGLAHSLQAAEQNQGFRTRRPVVELLGTCSQCTGKHRG